MSYTVNTADGYCYLWCGAGSLISVHVTRVFKRDSVREEKTRTWTGWRKRTKQTYNICCAAWCPSMCRWVNTSSPWARLSPGSLCRCTRSHNPPAGFAHCGSDTRMEEEEGRSSKCDWCSSLVVCAAYSIWLWQHSATEKSSTFVWTVTLWKTPLLRLGDEENPWEHLGCSVQSRYCVWMCVWMCRLWYCVLF